MATLVEWFPAGGGDPVLFATGTSAPYRLLSLNGLEPVTVAPIAIKSPNQPGDTVVDVVVPGRTVELSGLIQTNAADTWDLRATLARALVQQPTRLGESYVPGRLRVTIPGLQPLELDCVPRSSKIERPSGVKSLAPFDIEFYAPSPYWKEIADTQILFTSAGGFEFSVEYPLEMASNNVTVDLDNQGDVDAPILARFYGDITTGRVMNLTTGETLEITGNLPATKYWEINTGFGNKYVNEIIISTGATTGVMNKINLTYPDFWSLRPGLNTVKFEADVNTSGRAELYYRQRYSGI